MGYCQQSLRRRKATDEAPRTVRKIAANAPIAVRQAKKSLSVATQTDLKTGYSFEIEVYQKMMPTEDWIAGVRALNEKRRPKFQDL